MIVNVGGAALVFLALTALAIIAYRSGYLRGHTFRREARGVAVDARPASV